MNKTWLDQYRHLIFAGLLALALVGGGLFYWGQPAQTPIEIVATESAPPAASSPTAVPTATPTPAPVRVYVTGAVANSDVYFLPHGSIIKDAIQAAGGFTAEADPEQINQALELQDQQQIHVPRQGETNPPPPVQGGPAPGEAQAAQASGGGPQPAGGGRIDLNTASLEDLDTLSGIGPALAQRIIDYRESIGGFTAIEQITQVSGIGEATFAKIKDQITVE